jgi:hypothetical protein
MNYNKSKDVTKLKKDIQKKSTSVANRKHQQTKFDSFGGRSTSESPRPSSSSSASSNTRVVCVKVSSLRAGCSCCGQKYNTLQDWLQHPNHVYIGRKVYRIDGSFQSDWRNPYPVGKQYDLNEALRLYSEYLETETVLRNNARIELKGKTLGCWCAPNKCHGDLLKELVDKKEPEAEQREGEGRKEEKEEEDEEEQS